MEFDRSKVYTSVNADELRAGDKVIAAHQLGNLKYQVSQKDYYVQQDYNVWTIKEIKGETYSDRFVTVNGAFPLVYLVERAKNCTNCGEGRWDAEHKKILCDPVNCGNGNVVFRNHEIEVCDNWKPKTTEPKTEDKWCKNCGVEICSRAGVDANVRCPAWQPKIEKKCEDCEKAYTDYPCVANVYHDATGRACKNFEAEKHTNYNHCEEARKACVVTNACPEKHFRPFQNTDELVKVWCNKCPAHNHRERGLTMPLIWVRYKDKHIPQKGTLIRTFFEEAVSFDEKYLSFETLFKDYEFLDGSPCGVEE